MLWGRWAGWVAAVALAAAGCSDYFFAPGDDGGAEDPPEDDDTTPAPSDDDTSGTGDDDTGTQEDDDTTPDLPPCDEAMPADWQWWGSPPFSEEEDPTDGSGRPFWAVDFEMVDFSTVVLPDSGHIPTGHDRVYRSDFALDFVPADFFLSMQSDDGIWFWLNGIEVGHWGGDWQQEGCVNGDAECVTSQVVDPVWITPYLVAGPNVAAARISNPVMNDYFDAYTDCVD